MRFNICQKIIIRLLFVAIFSSNIVFGQLKNFGTVAKQKPESSYLFNVYGYYDFVREQGVGLQYSFLGLYNLDVSYYNIYPNGGFNFVSQWDYKDFNGQGISIKPKYQFSFLGRWYIGANVSYEWLKHGIVPVEYYYGRGSMYIYHYQESAKGNAYTIGITFGNKIRYQRIFIEPFFGIGYTEARLNKTIYGVDHKEPYQKSFPYSESIRQSFFQSNLGVKFGFSFKKSKKHSTIDEKFDKIYVPKSNTLKNYFKSVDFKNQTIKKDLRRALARYEALNRNALSKYKRHYNDTVKLYSKIDFLFNRIDSLIISGNK